MSDDLGMSGAGRRLIRRGIVMWGLRGADDLEYTVSAPPQG
jgi:hypothetical protein